MAERGRIAPGLLLCRGCRQFVVPDRADCRFCGGDIEALEADYQDRVAEMQAAAEALRLALARRPASNPSRG
jgi:hypothetical protein